MSNATFYRVELLITDNPAASHLSLSLYASHPHSSIVALLSLSLHLLPLSLFYCLTAVLSPQSSFLHLLSLKSVFTRGLASCSCVWLIIVCVYVCYVGRCCQWCGREPCGASKADYELILAKEAGNSFKPTKPFH